MYQSWYENHYHEMSGAGQWFRGGGFNTLPAERFVPSAWRVLIVRLSTFRDTSDSFTHQLLYQTAAQCENVFVDCAWLPPPEDGMLFDRDGIPWLTGVSKRPATDFDCIAISHSVVQELVNLPVLLKRAQSRLPGVNEKTVLICHLFFWVVQTVSPLNFRKMPGSLFFQ